MGGIGRTPPIALKGARPSWVNAIFRSPNGVATVSKAMDPTTVMAIGAACCGAPPRTPPVGVVLPCRRAGLLGVLQRQAQVARAGVGAVGVEAAWQGDGDAAAWARETKVGPDAGTSLASGDFDAAGHGTRRHKGRKGSTV